MWFCLNEKCYAGIAELRELDRHCHACGAEARRHTRRPRLSPRQLEQRQEALCAPPPQELASFYAEAGNGVAGPANGLTQADELSAPLGAEECRRIENDCEAAFGAGHEVQEDDVGVIPDARDLGGIRLASVAKPFEIFGDPAQNLIMVHGSTQARWFERVLGDWQAKNCS